MSITLIYTDCFKNNAGDFSAASEFAYSLQNYFYKNGENTKQCVLASSETGMGMYKRLHGTSDSSKLNVHGTTLEVVNLKDFVKTLKNNEVTEYIEVGECQPAPIGLVAKFVDPLSTKVLYVGLPNGHPLRANQLIQERFPQSFANGLAHGLTSGIGEDRIGVACPNDNFEAIKHDEYAGVTTHPFGLAYFRSGLGNSKELLKEYLLMSTKIDPNCKNFVYIGRPDYALEEVKDFVRGTKKPVNFYDQSKKTAFSCSFVSGQIEVNPLLSEQNDAINICVQKQRVPHEQMRALMKSSQPFIGVEGVNTIIEALVYGKIPFIQYFENNDEFFSGYKKRLDNLFPTYLKTELEQFFDLMIRRDNLSFSDQERLVNLIQNPNFRDVLLNANEKICESISNPAEAMNAALNLPAKLDPHYNGPAFDKDDEDNDLNLAMLQAYLSFLRRYASAQSNNKVSSNPSSLFSPKQNRLFSNNNPQQPRPSGMAI